MYTRRAVRPSKDLDRIYPNPPSVVMVLLLCAVCPPTLHIPYVWRKSSKKIVSAGGCYLILLTDMIILHVCVLHTVVPVYLSYDVPGTSCTILRCGGFPLTLSFCHLAQHGICGGLLFDVCVCVFYCCLYAMSIDAV